MNRLVSIIFDHSYNINKNVLTKKQLEILQTVCSKEIKAEQLSKYHIDNNTTWISSENKNHEDAKVLVDSYHISGHTDIVNLDALLDLDLPIRYSILHSIKELPERPIEVNLINTLLKMEERLNTFDKLQQFNYKVGVHISDLGLLNVRHVKVLLDCCVDTLQDTLLDGWRILAICPQPNQRRPDFIVGRGELE